MIQLSDDEIVLRPFIPQDAEAHLVSEDEAQEKWLSGGKSTLEGVRKWIEKNQVFWKNDGPVFNFAILNKENKLIGMVEANTDFTTIEGIQDGDANISYGLYSIYRGKGYTTRAVSLIIDFLKSKGIKRGVIRINPENKDSLKVPERCGFTENKTIITNKGERLVIFIKNLV